MLLNYLDYAHTSHALSVISLMSSGDASTMDNIQMLVSWVKLTNCKVVTPFLLLGVATLPWEDITQPPDSSQLHRLEEQDHL